MKKYFIIIPLSILILSCKKDRPETITFSGTIYNTGVNAPASGVNLKISYQEIQNASYSTAYTNAGNVTSNTDGSYHLEFDLPRATSYKFILSSPQHFTKELIENAETVEANNVRNFYVDAKAWFGVRIHNVSPVSGADQIIFQNTSEAYGCSTCCNNSAKIFNGMSLDTTLYCLKAGGQEIRFTWTVTKSGVSQTYTDSIVTVPYDTLIYDLAY